MVDFGKSNAPILRLQRAIHRNAVVKTPKTSIIEPFVPASTAAGASPDSALMPQCESSKKAGPKLILWDLVGSCNLRCPSCPVGTMSSVNPKGLIDRDLFYAILEKLRQEFPNWQLHYYNWTEPLIHPQIVEFSQAAAQAGFHLHLSSNLNYLKDPEGIMSAGAKTFRISLSGFSQSVYEISHSGGDVERVKRNMIRLSEAKKTTGSRMRTHVYYHKYAHNLHELSRMEEFARSLGFDFLADWAYLMPMEKLLAYIEGELPKSERAFADEHFVPSMHDAIAGMQPHRDSSCELIDQLVLDFQGNVSLCCATYDKAHNFIGKYLDMSWPDLQARKYVHNACAKCMHYGIHTFYTHFSKPDLRSIIDNLATSNLMVREAGPRGPIRLPVLNQQILAESA
jgi:pyruvate-formate lyase-activating enzyme